MGEKHTTDSQMWKEKQLLESCVVARACSDEPTAMQMARVPAEWQGFLKIGQEEKCPDVLGYLKTI